jgi:uncharacterized protein YyaL (SSP411 family)
MKTPNRLIHESSPYLLQHAYNPVQWQPWSPETLQQARDENKMLLVSIGYSACHWCHVMEHESFEDHEVAEIMNLNFICIKVDREERPDVDHFFMDAVQLLGGRGGWPLNCFALPNGKPVWGGTYFRKSQWKEILLQMAELWENQSADLLEQAEQLIQGLSNNYESAHDDDFQGDIVVSKMAENSKSTFDPLHGGTLGAPKFPMPAVLRFQLMAGLQHNDTRLLKHVEKSLLGMANGGIYDQIGGGFARYSVDERWHVPHFEKMLYDNAQLIGLYAAGFQHFKITQFEEVVRETIAFSLRELLAEEGLFYSALDADSEGVEGKFYVWTADELDQALGSEAELFSKWFGMGKEALWEDNLNVPVQPHDQIVFCEKHDLTPNEFQLKLKQTKKKLLENRSQRVHPALDDKRLLSWNALMISGLIEAYFVFQEEEWLATAQKAAHFVLSDMQQTDGGLYRSWKDGKAKIPAFLDDYSFFMEALIQLYQADHNEKHLLKANELLQYTLKHFFDADKNLFFFTPTYNNDLNVKPIETYDNVVPSSNAAICMGLVKLGIYFEEENYFAIAKKMLARQLNSMEKYPTSFAYWGQALHLLNHQPLLVAGGNKAQTELLKIKKTWSKNMLTATSKGSSSIPAVASKPLNQDLQLWFCDINGCRTPVAGTTQLTELLKYEAAK